MPRAVVLVASARILRACSRSTCIAAWQAGQRRYVLLFLWMAAQGGGVVPGKMLANAARRLRVTCVLSCACAALEPSYLSSFVMIQL